MKGSFCFLVQEGADPRGFLYAQERNAFDLCPDILWVEVCFLVGENCILDLLRRLRMETKKRILVPAWAHFGKLKAFDRLLHPMHPRVIGQWHEV